VTVYDLRYNEVSMKASHNTYQVEEPLVQLSGDGSSCSCHVIEQYRCRSIEIDVNQSPDGTQWSVEHGGSDYQLHDRQLSQFLNELRVWSQLNSGHDVITLLLCIKGVADPINFPEQLDSYVTRFMGIGNGTNSPKIFTPAMLMADNTNNIADGARTNGWPTLAALAGTFVVMLSGGNNDLATYAASPGQRLGFADIGFDQDGRNDTTPPTAQPNQVFVNYNLFTDDALVWTQNFAAVANDAATLLRGYQLDTPELFQKALAAGVNLLATGNLSQNNVHPSDAFILRPTIRQPGESGGPPQV
jgi:hypothetical protein